MVQLSDRGAAIVAIRVADGRGEYDNVIVAPGSAADFAASTKRYGAIVGRYAGRLRGSVTIDGRRYPLATNASGVTLHGGDPGFDRAVWRPRRFVTSNGSGVEFVLRSPDGAQGFPGELVVRARYTLDRDRNVLTLDLRADADRPTVANLTNHAYFNLSGAPTIACHTLQVDAERVIALDDRKLPTGELAPLASTPPDFRAPRVLAQTLAAGGMDRMFVAGERGATLIDRATGRRLRLTTTEPGLQIFTGDAFDGTERDARGRLIGRHAGIAIEAQHFPDSPNIAHFPTTRVAPGHPLISRTRWSFDRVRPTGCR